VKILITGGTGYIGSHTAVELMAAGHEVFLVDNLCNSKAAAVDRIARVAGRQPGFAPLDVRDRPALRQLFAEGRFDAVAHLAGLKSIAGSLAQPAEYHDNNVEGSRALFQCMAEAGVRTVAFSSSATVYGDGGEVPAGEDTSLAPTNPYAHSKVGVEAMLRDLAGEDRAWRVALLRFFNPAGAHPSGHLGDDPASASDGLMDRMVLVAAGRLKELHVYGGDYPTHDGTAVRDFIHIVDLARGHALALEAIRHRAGVLALNLGTGRGHSVLEMVRTFEAATGVEVPFRVVERRIGDVASSCANPGLALETLGWRSQFDVHSLCVHAWQWHRRLEENGS
jgi:UDP-glucose 4-epimerase